MNQLTTIQTITIWVLPVIFGVTVHEILHGYVAKLLGDDTALSLGRLSLNPAKHINFLGTIFVPLFLLLFNGVVFAWAKPIPINPSNFRKPRRDMALVALVGPLGNLVMAVLWGGIAKVAVWLLHHKIGGSLAIYYMGQAGMAFNSLLVVLNCIPLPPLDGGQILELFLPVSWVLWLEKFEPFGFFSVLFLLLTGILGVIINPVTASLLHGIKRLYGI